MIVLEKHNTKKITCAVFDFDGTLSTLRCGWENVMQPLMLEAVFGNDYTEEKIEKLISQLIDQVDNQSIFYEN